MNGVLVLMISLAQVLHLAGGDVQHPQWDTLIGLLNTNNQAVMARITLYDEDSGAKVMWPKFDGSSAASCDIILKPLAAWAATFIPGNGFNREFGSDCGPPLVDFKGHATIESTLPIKTWSMASGGGWDSAGPSINIPIRSELVERSEWAIPYVIPVFEDQNHSGVNAYTTGLSIQNFSNKAVNVTIIYRPNQNYPQWGQSWQFTRRLAPNGGMRTDLQEALRLPMATSEGSLEILSDVPAKLYPSAIIATKNYIFAAGEEFQ